MIKGKTPEEIRKTFNIKNDLTEAEEEQIRKENEWCEEKWSNVNLNESSQTFVNSGLLINMIQGNAGFGFRTSLIPFPFSFVINLSWKLTRC